MGGVLKIPHQRAWALPSATFFKFTASRRAWNASRTPWSSQMASTRRHAAGGRDRRSSTGCGECGERGCKFWV